jgi:hypothetical protein
MFQSQLIIIGLSCNIYKKEKRNTCKSIILILVYGIPQIHSYYNDKIMQLCWSVGR